MKHLMELLEGITVSGIIVGLLISEAINFFMHRYFYEKEENQDKYEKKSKSLIVHDFFLWEGSHLSSKRFTDDLGRERRCLFHVSFHYRADLTEENIALVLAFEKEYQVLNPDASTQLVGKTLWDMIRDRVVEASAAEFREDGEVFGELSIRERIHPFDKLMPGISLSKCGLVSVQYSVTTVV